MPKKTPPPDNAEPQIQRFRKAVRDLKAAGELSLTDADKAVDLLVRSASKHIFDSDKQKP